MSEPITITTEELDKDQEECRTCGELYPEGDDGYDGECPNCADKREARKCPNCEVDLEEDDEIVVISAYYQHYTPSNRTYRTDDGSMGEVDRIICGSCGELLPNYILAELNMDDFIDPTQDLPAVSAEELSAAWALARPMVHYSIWKTGTTPELTQAMAALDTLIVKLPV